MAVIGSTVRRRSIPQGRAVAARWVQKFDPRLLVAGVGDLPIYGSVLGKTIVQGYSPGGVGMQGNAGSTGGNVGYNVALSGRHLTIALSVTPGAYVASLPMLMETSADANANASQSPFFLLPYYDGSAASSSYWILAWYAFEGSVRYHILRFAAPPAGVPLSLVARADYNYGSAGVGRGIWINGQPYAYTVTQNTILNPQNFSTTTAYVNSRGRASLWGNSLVHSVGLLNAEVPDSLCRDISGNAALLYESDRRLFFFDDAVGGGTVHTGTYSESISLSDSLSSNASFTSGYADSITLTDQEAGPTTYNATLTDAISLIDDYQASTGGSIRIGLYDETITLSDSCLATLITAATYQDSITLTDSLSSAGIFISSLQDSITLTDSNLQDSNKLGSYDETISLQDSTTSIATFIATYVESITLGDSVSSQATLGVTIDETMTMQYSVTATIPGTGGTVSETVNIWC